MRSSSFTARLPRCSRGAKRQAAAGSLVQHCLQSTGVSQHPPPLPGAPPASFPSSSQCVTFLTRLPAEEGMDFQIPASRELGSVQAIVGYVWCSLERHPAGVLLGLTSEAAATDPPAIVTTHPSYGPTTRNGLQAPSVPLCSRVLGMLCGWWTSVLTTLALWIPRLIGHREQASGHLNLRPPGGPLPSTSWPSEVVVSHPPLSDTIPA